MASYGNSVHTYGHCRSRLLAKSPELLRKRLNTNEKEGEQKAVVALSGLLFIMSFTTAGLNWRYDCWVLPEWTVWTAAAAPGDWEAGLYQASMFGGPKDGAPAIATIPEAFPDLMKYVESHYRVLKGAKNTAMCGLSMGGGHTLNTTALYPDKFGYIGLFSGAFFDNDTEKLATVFANKPKLYFVACGKADPIARFSYEFVDYLEQMGYPHHSLWTDGAHTWKNWRNYLMIFAEQLFK